MTTDQCTPQQLAAIRAAALERARYMRWVADKLRTTDNQLIRLEAARLIEELARTE